MSLPATIHKSRRQPPGPARRLFWLGLVLALLQPGRGETVPSVLEALVKQIPNAGAGVYHEPDEAEQLAFSNLYAALARRDFEAAAPLAAAAGYELREFDDEATGRRLWLLSERAPWSRYRGICLLDPDDTALPMVVEVPHPRFDVHSWRLAGAIFGGADLRPFALVMTTAHRYDTGSKDAGPTPADVTHHTPSIFQVAHEALTMVGGRRYALQVHGFRETDAIHQAFGRERVDTILSQGWTAERQPLDWPDDGPAMRLLAGLRERGVEAVASQVRGDPLNAGQNPQGHFTNGGGGAGHGWFLHLEVCSRIRFGGASDPAVYRPVVEAVAAIDWRGAP